MAAPLTRQDMMAITDTAKNRIIERIVTRQDMQTMINYARDRLMTTMNTYNSENLNLIRQANSQNDQINRRIASLEAQLVASRQQMQMLTQAINRLYDVQAQQANQMRGKLLSEQAQVEPY